MMFSRNPSIYAMLRNADLFEYERFVEFYTVNGGQITHVYDYPFPVGGIKIAMSDGFLLRGCGADAIYVIEPKGINLDWFGLGHNHGQVFRMGEFHRVRWVPIYSNMKARVNCDDSKVVGREP